LTEGREMLASMAPEELRSAMRSLGYRTQNDLAQAIGVSRSAVSLWLEGKVGVPRPIAMLLRMLVNAQRRLLLVVEIEHGARQ
jgi:transcriptional regulator with XRE-family HTH domain